MYTLQSRYITVEGAIGTGKTSLALLLSSKYNVRAILEVVEKNPFLPHFYDDIKNYAFRTKIFFLLSRYDQQVKTIRQDLFQQLSFADYMFAKDSILHILLFREVNWLCTNTSIKLYFGIFRSPISQST